MAKKDNRIKLVGDADFLYHLSQEIIKDHDNVQLTDLIKNIHKKTILTPNVVEFDRLCNRLDIYETVQE